MGVDARGHVVLRKRLPRKQVLPFFARLPPCLIGLKASGAAHHLARELTKPGHTVKLMSPQLMRPYIQQQKNDATDAAGLCEAVRRPRMRFVPIKSVEQQDIQALHRIHERQIKARTALVNQIRGLLMEYGMVIPQGVGKVWQALPAILADAENGLTWDARAWLEALGVELRALEQCLKEPGPSSGRWRAKPRRGAGGCRASRHDAGRTAPVWPMRTKWPGLSGYYWLRANGIAAPAAWWPTA